ncbi:tRNA glutamyl-Q(34) synthetase GluQRS [Bryobacter aggregatus]|uniref:tRNA glutamyl-Q(34) synthetase GluQRS n=1 Tax=Bryobacter aggregatus TaxID=360054 RepID=UPI0004E25DC6|nr:tRNA glutamyl-Q(34) synthetase GluQRS [Bryobacter aggregatus]
MYCGRFAPSPTGPLHFGSLVAATASYLDARAQRGQWLLRMEDTDHTRCRPHYADEILSTLSAFGFVWDEPVIVQSERSALYDAAIAQLGPRVYHCTCSRREIATLAAQNESRYPGICRNGCDPAKPVRALRLAVEDPAISDDFILFSTTGKIYSYQLAVVVDDEAQGITHVVRGADLLSSTPRQQYLQRLLGYRTLQYLHLPLATGPDGTKLSKQNLAPALDTASSTTLLVQALEFLQQQPEENLARQSLANIWAWAIANWRPERLRRYS